MKLIQSVCLVFAITSLTACTTVVKERVVEERPPSSVVVKHAPAPIVEVVPVSPGAGQTWIAGHWVWRDTNWQWVPGHWHAGHVRSMPPIIVEEITVAPAPHAYWVPGHWKFEAGDWVWVNGRWHR